MRSTAAAALLAAAILTVAAAAPAVAAGNPSGTGLPSQSCQDIVAGGGSTPGPRQHLPRLTVQRTRHRQPQRRHGGQHYNETSQYDVACFQVSQH